MDIENKKNINCPVKDLLSLIQQDDVEQLRNALLNAINNTYPNSELYLYKHGYSVYGANNKHFAPTLLTCRDSKNNCEKKAQDKESSTTNNSVHFDGFKYLPTDDYVQVFTVESERSNRGLLITVNEDIIDEQYIHTLLSAYNHQVYLLRNKDTDSLTGLFNRQSFDSKLSKLHSSLSNENRNDDFPSQFCFALFDIDFLKSE